MLIIKTNKKYYTKLCCYDAKLFDESTKNNKKY